MESSAVHSENCKVPQRVTRKRSVKCLACGTTKIKSGRRYCSKECRQQIMWVLSLSKGLLRTFNARYAAFSFTEEHVILDVLPVWTKGISRFIYRRTTGRKPAEDLKHLILASGEQWYELVGNKNSKSYASLMLLMKNHNEEIDPTTVMPNKKTSLRLSQKHKSYLKILDLSKEDLTAEDPHNKIRSAYKKMAKIYHPDKGGDAEKFKILNEAHQQMLVWVENPQYTCRRALQGCWSYDGSTNRWSPPL